MVNGLNKILCSIFSYIPSSKIILCKFYMGYFIVPTCKEDFCTLFMPFFFFLIGIKFHIYILFISLSIVSAGQCNNKMIYLIFLKTCCFLTELLNKIFISFVYERVGTRNLERLSTLYSMY